MIDATINNKPFFERNITINPENTTFLDVETGLPFSPYNKQVWLVGIFYKQKIYQFKIPFEEKDLFLFLRKHNISEVATWSKYDREALNPILEKHRYKMKFIDAMYRTSKCLFWKSYKQEDIHKLLFPKSKNKILIDGYEMGVYTQHLILNNEKCPYCKNVDKKELENRIIEKNKEDLIRMKKIVEYLYYEAPKKIKIN